ncbi:hypothetical protein DV20_25190 [Amycolatopsis rifamycinica]|uniref:Uncharacterized protein n=1 Tax=Amycolatopsis rifamycinica TaxID=287986 RepID=A0A066U0Q7_9PSEU|nr:hypothetical protein DV20_25190 [Amycolatopsis rifamycinica]
MAGRPSREAVARWNEAYAEQTSALFAAMRSASDDLAAVRRLAHAYHAVAVAWRALSADLAAPLWARHASAVAAEEFERRARMEFDRADSAQRPGEIT